MNKALLHAALVTSLVIYEPEAGGLKKHVLAPAGFDVFAKTGKKKCKKTVPFWYPFSVPKMGPLICGLIKNPIKNPKLGSFLGTKNGHQNGTDFFAIFLPAFANKNRSRERQEMFRKPPEFLLSHK